jgi:hypothetical protein
MPIAIKYWEVWNEPNSTGFWPAPFSEYLKLYDHAVRGAKRADPTVKVGGPTITVSGPAVLDRPEGDKFPPELLIKHSQAVTNWAPAAVPSHTNYHGENPFALMAAFILHCGESRVPLDFLTWHNYNDAPGLDPFDLTTFGNNLRLFRSWLGHYPQFRDTELVIDEWGILGDKGTLKAAIFHGSALVEMEMAGLAFQENYEVVDAEAGRFASAAPSEPIYWRKPPSSGMHKEGEIPIPPLQSLTELFALLGRTGREATSSNNHIRVLASRDGDNISVVLIRFAPDADADDVLLTITPLPTGRPWNVAGHLLDSKHANSSINKGMFRLERNENGDVFGIGISMDGLSAAAVRLLG